MPDRLWREWIEFAREEPFGPQAWDARIGWILAVLVQAITGQRTQAADFIPKWAAGVPKQSETAMRAVVRAWGGRVNAYHRQDPG